MTTPILMLVLLTLPWLVCRLFTKVTQCNFDSQAAAAIGLGVLFLFTGMGHFVKTETMTTMLPACVPMKTQVIQFSGILEWVIAIALFRSCYRIVAAKAAAVLLIALFPLNVYAAINHAPMDGHEWGPVYLWIRGPLQAITLGWIYFMILRKS